MFAGFASADVTPAVGNEAPGGFSKAFGQSIHDPLLATAAVFEDGTTRVALVGLDNLSVKVSVVRAARKMIEERCGIPGGNVMIGASHTHSGGPCVGAALRPRERSGSCATSSAGTTARRRRTTAAPPRQETDRSEVSL